MSVIFQHLEELGPDDLNIVITDAFNVPINPSDITYTIKYFAPGCPNGEVMPPANRTPQNPAIGTFWADLQIPQGWPYGLYQIVWRWRLSTSNPYLAQAQQFQVVQMSTCRARVMPVTGTFIGTKFQII